MKKIIFSALLLIESIFLFGQAVGDFTFEIVGTGSAGTITITGYNGNSKNVVIPEKLNGFPVTVIGPDVFSEKKLSTIILPKTLKEIKNGAFTFCTLTEIQLPESLEIIGMSAFAGSEIKKINIPKNIRMIEECAFGFTSIYDNLELSVRNELIEKFGEDIFYSPW